MDIKDVIMEAVISVLSEKVNSGILKKVSTKELKEKLYRKLTNEVFYKILRDKKISLFAGFGTIRVKEVQRNKKCYDRISKTTTATDITARKMVYKPGSFIKQFL
jgi:hypothetical protein